MFFSNSSGCEAGHAGQLHYAILAVKKICESEDLVFIEDAAQAHGAAYQRRKAGSLGDMGCFSFYATKNMATGGAVW